MRQANYTRESVCSPAWEGLSGGTEYKIGTEYKLVRISVFLAPSQKKIYSE